MGAEKIGMVQGHLINAAALHFDSKSIVGRRLTHNIYHDIYYVGGEEDGDSKNI